MDNNNNNNNKARSKRGGKQIEKKREKVGGRRRRWCSWRSHDDGQSAQVVEKEEIDWTARSDSQVKWWAIDEGKGTYLSSSSETGRRVADFGRLLGLGARPQGGQYDDNDEQDQDEHQQER